MSKNRKFLQKVLAKDGIVLALVAQNVKSGDAHDTPIKCYIDKKYASESYKKYFIYSFEPLAPIIREYMAILTFGYCTYSGQIFHPKRQQPFKSSRTKWDSFLEFNNDKFNKA